MILCTPKGLHTTAQGRDRRSRTLGERTSPERTLKGFHTGVEPLQGSSLRFNPTQSRLPLVANPGLSPVTPSGYRVPLDEQDLLTNSIGVPHNLLIKGAIP